MSSQLITPPYSVYQDKSGQPLSNGYIYIGKPNLNPQTTPVSVYFNEALTVPATQPIRTIGGYPSQNGSPARLFVSGDYSIAVRDRNKTLVYSSYSNVLFNYITSDELPWFNALDYGRNDKTGATVLNAINSINETRSYYLLLEPGDWLFGDVTTPSNVILLITPGAFINMLSGATLNYGGPEVSYASGTQVFKMANDAVTNFTSYYVKQLEPEMWGAVGDDVANDYYPLLHCINTLNSMNIGSIYFSRPSYYAGEYRDINPASPNGIKNYIITAEYVTFYSRGSRIRYRANFTRSSNGYKRSIKTQFVKQKKLVVRNLNFFGDNTAGSKGTQVAEVGEHGLELVGGSDVLLENVNSDYMANDGFYFDHHYDGTLAIDFPLQRLTCINIKANYNARQGLSMIGAFDFCFINCNFSYTGRSSFGSFAPAAGIDIEPDVNYLVVNNGSFKGLTCEGNVGGTFLCTGRGGNVGKPADGIVKNISLSDAKLISSDTSGDLQFAFSIVGGQMMRCVFDGSLTTDNQSIFSLTENASKVNVSLKDCFIKGTGQFFRAEYSSSQTRDDVFVDIDNCVLETSPIDIGTLATKISIKASGRFKNNTVTILDSSTASTQAAVSLQQLDEVYGNKYTQDFTGGKVANITYLNSEVVYNESYFGELAGYSFSGLSHIPTTRMAKKGLHEFSIGSQLNAMDLSGNVMSRFYFNVVAPPLGVYTNSDFVFNNNMAAGGFLGWACTTSGGAKSTTRTNTTAYSQGVWALWTTGTTVWECTTAGTSAGSAPSIVGLVVGDTVVDGTVTWTMRSLTTAVFKPAGDILP